MGGGTILAALIASVPLAIYGLLAAQYPPLFAFQRVRDLEPYMLRVFSPGFGQMYLPALAAAIFGLTLWLYRRGTISRSALAVAVVAITVGDLATFGSSFNPAVPQSYLFPPTNASRLVDKLLATSGPGRVLGINDDLAPGTNIPYRYADIAGTDFPGQRYQTLALALGGTMRGSARIAFESYPGRLADLLGVRVAVSSVPQTGPTAAQLRVAQTFDWVTVYENPDALPRARLVHSVEQIADDKAILQRLADERFDPRQSVILEETPPFPPRPAAGDEMVSLSDEGPQQMRIKVRASADSLLVIADSYYPGWQASLDGRPTTLLRANYAFRAVAVPAGEHEVLLSYTPSRFRLGLTVSAAGLAVILGWLAVAIWPGWRRRA
jgi:hypothetical protein